MGENDATRFDPAQDVGLDLSRTGTYPIVQVRIPTIDIPLNDVVAPLLYSDSTLPVPHPSTWWAEIDREFAISETVDQSVSAFNLRLCSLAKPVGTGVSSRHGLQITLHFVGPCVIAHLMAFVHHSLDQLGLCCSHMAYHKKCGANTMVFQGIQYHRGGTNSWAIVQC